MIRREDPHDGHDAALLDGLRVTEVMYNPYDPGPLEFIELQNTSDQAVNLGGVRIGEALEFTFPEMIVEPGGRVVAVQNVPAFVAHYGTTARVAGQYGDTLDDFQLSNSGESLRLEDSLGRTIQEFSYNDAANWPGRADGKGSSLEIIDTSGDYGDGQNWRSSSIFGGTPGNAAVAPVVDVVINEVLSHTDPPLTDSIELYNTTSRPVDIGGWWVSDSSDDFRKYRIPAGTVLGAGKYLVLNESHFNASGGANSRDFALSSSHGDDLWLVQADSSGRLLRVADHVSFGATETGVSLGRWPNGTGPLFPAISRTLGGANSGPRPGDVIVSEVHYNPVDADGAGPLFAADIEFVELYNRTTSTVDLTGCALAEGVDITFGAGTTLGPRQTVLVVPFAPGDQQQLDLFRLAYNLGPAARLIGPYAGTLDNGGETIRLERPDTPPQEEPDFTPYLLVDRITYDDQSPWPLTPDGAGDSLSRASSVALGDLPGSWTAARPSPGSANLFVRQAGDANEDGRFDQLDLVLTLQGGRYLSAQPATWQTGDWNGDGRFNQLDIIAALQSGNYLRAPYASQAASGQLSRVDQAESGRVAARHVTGDELLCRPTLPSRAESRVAAAQGIAGDVLDQLYAAAVDLLMRDDR